MKKIRNTMVIILVSMILAGVAVGIGDMVARKPVVWRFPECGHRQVKPEEIPSCPLEDHTSFHYGWPYITKSVTKYEDGRVTVRKGVMASNVPFPLDLWYGAFLNWVIFTLGFLVLGFIVVKIRSRQVV